MASVCRKIHKRKLSGTPGDGGEATPGCRPWLGPSLRLTAAAPDRIGWGRSGSLAAPQTKSSLSAGRTERRLSARGVFVGRGWRPWRRTIQPTSLIRRRSRCIYWRERGASCVRAASQCVRLQLRTKPSDLRVVSLASTTRCITRTEKFGRRPNESPGAQDRARSWVAWVRLFALFRELTGVAQQVEQHLLEPHGVRRWAGHVLFRFDRRRCVRSLRKG